MTGGSPATLRNLTTALAALALLVLSTFSSTAVAEFRQGVRPAVLVTTLGETPRHALQRLTSGATGRTPVTNHLPGMMATIAGDARFTGFASAVRTAQADGMVASSGPFTLFLPTDQAFSQLSPEIRQRLLDDPDTVAELVRYHLVPGRLTADQVESMSHLATVQGSTLTVSELSVISPDIEASNGMIHVVAKVLTPPGLEAPVDTTRDTHQHPRTTR